MRTEKMSLKEFKEKYMSGSSRWNFDAFDIVCKKCGSKKVEFNGYLESTTGYYDSAYFSGKIVVKCHDCGNAFMMQFDDNFSEELNVDGEKRTKYFEAPQ